MSIEIHNEEDKSYLVFGAPHSATSFVAQSLMKNGVKLRITNKDYYESHATRNLNRRILLAAGGELDDPPEREDILEVKEYDQDIKDIIESSKGDFWGIKDPRFSMTAHKWLPFIEGDKYLICCFRKPEKVVESWRNSSSSLNMSRKVVDKINESIIETIREFCEL